MDTPTLPSRAMTDTITYVECPDCAGVGSFRVMERVYPNEPHMADIGSEKCVRCAGTGEIEYDPNDPANDYDGDASMMPDYRPSPEERDDDFSDST